MEKYDSALLGILQSEGKVAPFLDVILGFLYRRTDFFRLMKTENDKLGFPPGVAKKLLMNIYSKYEVLSLKDAEKLEEMKRAREANQGEKEQKSSTDSPAVKANKVSLETSQSSEVNPTKIPQTAEDERGMEEVVDPDDITPGKENRMDTGLIATDLKSEQECEKESSKENDESEDKEDPQQAQERRLLQANPLTYNGAERDNYLWSQTITEADLRVKIPKWIVKGKQVRVDIAKKHIRVSHQKEDGSWCETVNNSLEWEINTEESMWTLTPGEFVHINLEKREERWWECVFLDEPKINTRKIDCSRPMTDLDDEAQAKIEEMMYNQRQKQLGLPQSHEQKTHDMLRKAWDAEGSPFKGQPFDPSKFNVDANGVVNMNQP